MRVAVLSLLVGNLLLYGCASSLVTLTSDGLAYERNDLRIAFASEGSGVFINDNWEVENWESNKRESSEWRTQWKRKNGDKYLGTVVRDMDDDGNVEESEEYFTELTLRHKRNDAQIYVDLTILPDSKRATDVDVFLTNFVENLSGDTSWYKISPFGQFDSEGRTYASKTVRKQRLKVGSHNAILATVELANLDQLKLDTTHRSRIISVVLVKLPNFVTDDWNRSATNTVSYKTKAAVLAVVLSARPVDHGGAYKDFISFLSCVNLDGATIILPEKQLPLRATTGVAVVPPRPKNKSKALAKSIRESAPKPQKKSGSPVESGLAPDVPPKEAGASQGRTDESVSGEVGNPAVTKKRSDAQILPTDESADSDSGEAPMHPYVHPSIR